LLGTVRHSETLEEMALYETLYENELGRLWVRPKEMFFENVNIQDVTRPRFEKINFLFNSHRELSPDSIREVSGLYELCFKSALDLKKLNAVLQMHKNILLITCHENSRLLGFKLGYGKEGDTFYSWIGGVHPDFRGLGIAGELMAVQHDECKKDGYKKIETRTKNEFSKMIRVNLAHGFRISGTLISAGGNVKIVMEKLLN
jgi:GNAT superfamily N-acetyltransferase